MAAKSSKKRKYYKVTFKLSKSEYNYLNTCAMLDDSTPNKTIKKYLREGFEGMQSRVAEWESQKQPNNQLDLFAWIKEPEFEQSSLLAEEGFFYDVEK